MFRGFLSGYKYLENYLYNSENWTPNQVKWFDTLYNVNIMGFQPWRGTADYFYGKRSAEEYRSNYGISGGGHDPRKLASQQGSIINTSFGSLNFISKNVERLYK